MAADHGEAFEGHCARHCRCMALGWSGRWAVERLGLRPFIRARVEGVAQSVVLSLELYFTGRACNGLVLCVHYGPGSEGQCMYLQVYIGRAAEPDSSTSVPDLFSAIDVGSGSLELLFSSRSALRVAVHCLAVQTACLDYLPTQGYLRRVGGLLHSIVVVASIPLSVQSHFLGHSAIV